MPYQITENILKTFDKENFIYLLEDNDRIQYKETIISSEEILPFFHRRCTAIKGIELIRLMDIVLDVHNLNIVLNVISANKLAKMEHKGKTKEFLEKYKIVGLTKCKQTGNKITEKKLEELFKAEKRFHGRSPKILPQIAAVCDYYGIRPQMAIDKFTINSVSTLLNAGIPKIETILLYTQLSERQLNRILNNKYVAQMVSVLLDKSFKKEEKGNNFEAEAYRNAAFWIADHAESDIHFLEKVYDKAIDLKLTPNTTIDNVYTQFSNNKALNEVAKIEKAYKKCGFKLKNCVCELRKSTSQTTRYTAEILEGNDPKQVMLGYDTDCCQHLGEAGESAMMHGLLHPKAGFWVVTKTDSGKVVAQAEIWELNADTLVFDNIEFANDAEIDQYKEIIGKWVNESRYSNIIMGCGYNTLQSDLFEHAGAVIPPVTPYELYVLSYEEDCDAREEICCLPSEKRAKELMDRGEITYFDYVYCDSERSSVYLKRNNTLTRFFTDETLTIHTPEQRSPYENEEYEDDYDDWDRDYNDNY